MGSSFGGGHGLPHLCIRVLFNDGGEDEEVEGGEDEDSFSLWNIGHMQILSRALYTHSHLIFTPTQVASIATPVLY